MNAPTKRVEFVSYTGKYPNLCRGILTLLIDGRPYKFDVTGCSSIDVNGLDRAAAKVNEGLFVATAESFVSMSSGGGVHFDRNYNEDVSQGPWVVSVSPDLFGLKGEIEQEINDSIRWGCCGGCV